MMQANARRSGGPHFLTIGLRTARSNGVAQLLSIGTTLFAIAVHTAEQAIAAGSEPGDAIHWRLPTEVLGAGDAFSATMLNNLDYFPGSGGPMPGPNFGERVAVTHLPPVDGGIGDVIVAASLSGISLRRTASGGFEPYPDCDPSTDAYRNTGAIALFRLPKGGLRYELETVILPSQPEVEAVLPGIPEACDYFGGCIAGSRLALSGRSLATITGAIGSYAEAHPAVSRLRVYRRNDSGAWLEENVRIDLAVEDQWITAADVDFIDENTLVAVAGSQVVTDDMNVPPREIRVFKRTPSATSGFDWTVSPDYPDLAFSSHDLGGVVASKFHPSGTGEWPRIDAMTVGAGDPHGVGIRVVIGAPGYTVRPTDGFPETRGAVYRVHLQDRRAHASAAALSERIAEGENDPSAAPLDRRVGHSVALDADRLYFSTIGTYGVPQLAAASDAIVAIDHDDHVAWQAANPGDREIITPPSLPAPSAQVLPSAIEQRAGIGFGRDMAVQNGGLVIRSVQYPYGIAGGPVLAQRFEPVAGQAAWKLTDVYETGRPICDETYGFASGSLAVSETGLVFLGDPTLGGGFTQDPGAAWLFSDTNDTNGDGVADSGEADGVELVVIDEWSVDLSTGVIGSVVTSPIARAVGISEQFRAHYAGSPVRVTCIRTAGFNVALQPSVLEYSSVMQSAHGSSHMLSSRVELIDPGASSLPVANCLRQGDLGSRPAHEAELLSDVAARWPWRAKHRVVLALTHDCDQLAVPNLVIAPETDPKIVSAVIHEAAAVNEHRTNLFEFLEAVDRANSLVFGDAYDPRLVCADESIPCDLIPCVAPTLLMNGAFDPTLGYAPANGIAARIRADLNNDGNVGAADIAILLAGWGTVSGDITGDGLTDAADVASLLAMWFTNPCH